MNSTSNKKNTINSSVLHVVDKLPSLRSEGIFKRGGVFNTNGSNKEDQSMATDRARHAAEDETNYSLAEKSTIEEEESSNDGNDGDDDIFSTTTAKTDKNNNKNNNKNNSGSCTYLQEKDAMSMSANSSANFSFFPSGQESMDAYPALYAPDTQAAYEKMKAEEEERKFQQAKWEPVRVAVEFFKGGMNKVFSFLERLCTNDSKQ